MGSRQGSLPYNTLRRTERACCAARMIPGIVFRGLAGISAALRRGRLHPRAGDGALLPAKVARLPHGDPGARARLEGAAPLPPLATAYIATPRDLNGIVWVMNHSASYALVGIGLLDLFAQGWLLGEWAPARVVGRRVLVPARGDATDLWPPLGRLANPRLVRCAGRAALVGRATMKPDEILRQTARRPWPLPKGPWVMRQTWDRLLFAHWPVPFDALARWFPPHWSLTATMARRGWASYRS